MNYSNSPTLYEFEDAPCASNMPPLSIFMLLTIISLYAATTMTSDLHAGPVMCYNLITNSATITCQKAREQGKESIKWDTDIV